MTKVFAIIVTYNGMHWYDRCFGSLRRSVMPVQTVVVDNASSDNTVEFIRQHYPEITLLPSDVNLGFGQGNNKGIRYALDHDADYVFLLNQDAWIEPDTIGELIRIHQENPEFGILSPMQFTSSKNSISEGLNTYLKGIKDSSFIEDLFFSKHKDVYEIESLPASVWLIPKHILFSIGGFDPIFFHYGEDDNYVQRIKYFGYKIGFCPKIKVVHDSENIKLPGKIIYSNNQAINKNILLLRWLDINSEFNMIYYSVKYVEKLISKILKLNIKASKSIFDEMKYMITMIKKVRKSRTQNKKAGRSWLS